MSKGQNELLLQRYKKEEVSIFDEKWQLVTPNEGNIVVIYLLIKVSVHFARPSKSPSDILVRNLFCLNKIYEF